LQRQRCKCYWLDSLDKSPRCWCGPGSGDRGNGPASHWHLCCIVIITVPNWFKPTDPAVTTGCAFTFAGAAQCTRAF
jgi:hypothetical protein